MLTKLIIELAFILICWGMGRWQAWWFDIKQKKISHFLWSAIYGLALIPAFIITHSIPLVVACGLMHISVFNTFLNFYRTPKRAILYINKDGDSWLDRQWYKFYPAVFFASLAAIIALQYPIFK